MDDCGNNLALGIAYDESHASTLLSGSPYIPFSKITPEATFLNRRFLMKASIWPGSTLATAGRYRVRQALKSRSEPPGDNAQLPRIMIRGAPENQIAPG